jgi:release factor glutamine methyltransferase
VGVWHRGWACGYCYPQVTRVKHVVYLPGWPTPDPRGRPAGSGGDRLSPSVGSRSCRFGPLLVEFDERVLTPRSWTFQQSEWAVELAGAEPGPILELCAGAGHIGLAAAVLAGLDLVQVEADPVAASYARFNAARAGWSARVEVRNARLEEALQPQERFGVIIADPPYLPSADINRWPEDPPMAIDGGTDGLDLVRACLQLAAGHLTRAGRLLLQIAGPSQAQHITGLIAATPGWDLLRGELRVIDDERAILLISRTPR